MSEIFPCSKCDNDDLNVEENYIDSQLTEYFIECKCGNRENDYESRENVIEKWNDVN